MVVINTGGEVTKCDRFDFVRLADGGGGSAAAGCNGFHRAQILALDLTSAVDVY